MITYRIWEEEGIVIIEPSSPIRQSDFEALTKTSTIMSGIKE